MASLEGALRLFVQPHLAREREQDPTADVLHQLAAADRLRGHRRDLVATHIGRGAVVADLGLVTRLDQRQCELALDRAGRRFVRRCECERSLRAAAPLAPPIVPHPPHRRVHETLFAWLFTMDVDRHSSRVEHRVPGSPQLRGDLRDLALSRADHRSKPFRLLLASQPAQIFVADPECSRESPEVELLRLRERHSQYVPRSPVVVVDIEPADQRAADVHTRDAIAHEHRTVRRETADIVRGRRRSIRQGQVESFHRHEDIR